MPITRYVDRYFAVRAGTPLWSELSSELRGREFRVPYRWWKECQLPLKDWKLLVKKGAAGKMAYVHKFERIDYKDFVN